MCANMGTNDHSKRRAFSLIEIIIAVFFVGILSVVAVSNLLGSRSKTELDSTTKQIAALLREAQSRSVSQAENASWGVHFDNSTSSTPFYALFKAPYSTSTVISRFTLPTRIEFATSSIALGGTLDVTFAQLSGAPSTSTSIVVRQKADPSSSSTITVSASGLISF